MKIEEIRKILKPQAYSKLEKSNCFGEFIDGNDMINIYDFIRRQQDEIEKLKFENLALQSDKVDNMLKASESNLSLDCVSVECEHPYYAVYRKMDFEKCTKCGKILCEG